MFLRLEREISDVSPDILFRFGDFHIANSTTTILLIIAIFVIAIILINRNLSLKPGKLQIIVEVIYGAMENLIGQITPIKRHFRAIFPIVATIIVYLVMANFIGLVPGLSSITYDDVSIFRTPTADFNTTFGLAVAMILFANVVSVKEYGILGYLNRFIQVKELYQGAKQGVGGFFSALIGFAIGLLDIISEFAKVVSLSLRLFGNMYAGEVLAVIILGGLAYFLPAVWLAMNLLSAVVQALVFGSLVAAYYTMSVKEEA